MHVGARLGSSIAALSRNRRGNVLIGFAAALVPLMAMVGSGVDLARAYTVKTRLQQACDAASLAGRRAMLHDKIDDDVRAEVGKFFSFNFPQKLLGSTEFKPSLSQPASGTLAIDASTTVPTLLMFLFGYKEIPVAVTCHAQQSFINVDVVLVLDVTGSMNDKLGSGQKKIEAMRSAVMSLYKQLAPLQKSLEDNGYRLRYGIVPYSQAVNVGKLLFAANPLYINQNETARYVRITGSGGSNSDPDISWTTTGIAHSTDWMKSSNYSGCVEERQTIASAQAVPTAAELAQMTDLDIDLLPSSDATRWAPADPDPNVKKNGLVSCPAEAVRLKAFTEQDLDKYLNGLTPTGATYLDLGMIWGARFISQAGVFADSPETYNGMHTNKYMVFLTDGEMDPQAGSYTGYSHEVLLRRVSVGTQNVNPLNKSVSASNAMKNDLTARHNARFAAQCRAVRNKGVSVWTIKIADKAMDKNLQDCANVDQSATVDTKDKLIEQFARIGQDISELRLTK